MEDERVDSEIVTQFLLNTCRLRPQLNEHAVQAVKCCADVATRHPGDDVEADRIMLTTGSVDEFYIEPMFPYVNDIDAMHYESTRLAIPRGHPPPTQLPAEFHNYVKVNEIIDSHLPGYVYLKSCYLLTYCPDDEKYNYVEYDQKVRLGVVGKRAGTVHGPALVAVYDNSLLLSMDLVRCIRCLSWPSQAADWSTRQRNYDWPDSATVDRVVNNGCDVVHVAHHQCRHDERMSMYQWRLSFSRAEIISINSWMPVQQIVYHMLRVFMKAKQLTDSVDNTRTKILSNYNIKTLMLWACELKPRSWRTDDLNLIRTCVELLHTLAVWLSEARCQNYFIHDCNLLDHVDNSLSTSQRAVSELMSVTETSLCDWFINCCIRQCAQLCPQHIARLFDDVSTSTRLQNAVAAVVDWRMNVQPTLSYHSFVSTHTMIANVVSDSSLTVPSCMYWIRELPVIYEDLLVYFLAVSFLHVAVKISKNSLTNELLDVLSTIFLQSNPVCHRRIARHSSVLSLSQAAKLMKVVANKSRSTVQLIEIELSKLYLHRALRCKDSDSDSIYCLANVYLAVLYYTTGQYQTAIDHCTLVTRSQDHLQCSSHVVQGELLPKIDDDIDIVLGLAVFYQYVLSAALNQRQTQYVSIFATELFTYYLKMKFLAVTKYPIVTEMSSCDTDILPRCVKRILEIDQPFISDILLYKSIISTLKSADNSTMELVSCGRFDRFVTSETELNTSQLATLLQKSAVEHLTTSRHLEAQQFGSVATVVTTDFEALYAYKHGDYQRCLQLSTPNVRTLLYARSLSHVLIKPPFIELFDDDIVSLTALTLVVNPECRERTDDASIGQLTLSLYLMTQCQLKLRHSLMSVAETVDHIEVAQRRHPVRRSLDQLTLKLAERKILMYLTLTMNN